MSSAQRFALKITSAQGFTLKMTSAQRCTLKMPCPCFRYKLWLSWFQTTIVFLYYFHFFFSFHMNWNTICNSLESWMIHRTLIPLACILRRRQSGRFQLPSIVASSYCYNSVIGVFLAVPCDKRKSSPLMDFIRGCGDCPKDAFGWYLLPLVDMLSTVSCGSAAWTCDR